MQKRTLRVLPLLLAPIAAAACAGANASQTPTGTVVHITERDFHISAPAYLAPGNVRLIVHNAGPDDHELIVVRDPDPKLPLRSDGATVNEEGLHPVTVGALEPGAPGSTRELDVKLTPGTYELFCNMGGHYLGGMEAVIRVS